MDGSIDDKKSQSGILFFAAGAALAAVGRVRVQRVCATPSQQIAQSRITSCMRARGRRRGDNARKIRKLSQNCELLSERTKGTEVKWRVEALASL